MSIFQNQSALIADRFKITDTTFPIQATGVLTLTATPLDTETVTIDGKVYTFQTVLTNVNGNVLIGASANDALNNLIDAIVLGPGSGTLYAALTTLHPTIKAEDGPGDTLNAIARLAGVQGTLITTTEALTNGSWGDTTLTGGVSAIDWLLFDKVDNQPNEGTDGEHIIKKKSNFLPAVNGKIPLIGGDIYTIKGDVDISPDTFEIQGSERVTMRGQTNAKRSVIRTNSTATLFTADSIIDRLAIEHMVIVGTGAGSTLFELTGNPASSFSIDTNAFSGFPNLGNIDTFNVCAIQFTTFTGIASGLNVKDVFLHSYLQVLFQGTGAGSDAHLRILGSRTQALVAQTNPLIPFVNESSFFIEPIISVTAKINIQNSIPIKVAGVPQGAFFETGNTGSITLFANAAVTTTTINSVTDSSGIARFNFTVGPTLFVGQKVTIAGYTTNTAYNITGDITVTGAGFFEISSIAFGSDEAGGSFNGESTTVTSTAHGESNGQALLIAGTINYNGGFKIYNALTNTFQINTIFLAAETVGNWDTGSLTQRERRMNCLNNGQIQDSMNVAFGGMNANPGATTIALADTYQALDFNTMTESPITELWTLIDATNGIFRYDGLNPVTGSFAASITVVKSGSTQIYRFTLTKNGIIPVFATADYVPVEIKTTQINVTLIAPIAVVPGDTIQVMGAGQGTDNNLTITDFFMQVII